MRKLDEKTFGVNTRTDTIIALVFFIIRFNNPAQVQGLGLQKMYMNWESPSLSASSSKNYRCR